MFRIFLKNKKTLLFILLTSILLILLFTRNTLGMRYYEKLDFVTGLVTANALNVRAGPRNYV